MADLERTIQLIFQATDNTAQGIASVASGITRVNDSVLNIAGPVADFAKSLLAIEAAAFAAGAGIAILASDKATEFEISFREIATLIDQPVEALGEFRQSILDFAAGSTQGLDQVITSTYSAISAGIDYTNSLQAVGIAEKLAIAGKANLGETLVGLVSTLNAYGLSIDDANRISDIFFTTVKLGQTTIPELNANLASVTGIAATAQIPFEEIGAAIATITASGSPTSSAITQIQAAISAIIKPSSEAATLAEELGIQFNSTGLATLGLKGVLDQAAAATGGNVEQMALLFGRVEGLKGALTLSGTSAEKFTSNLDAMRNSTGATEIAAGKFSDVLDTGKDALDVLLISLGTPLIAAFYEARAAITDITNAISAAAVSTGGLTSIVSLIEELSNDFAASVRAIATNLPAALKSADFSDFEKGIRAVVDALRNLAGGFDITSVEGLKAAIEKLGAAFLGLSEFTAGAIEAIGPLVAKIAELAIELPSIDSSFLTLAGNVGGAAIAINTILPAVNTLLLGFIALGGAGGAIASVGSGLASLGGIAAGAAGGFGAVAAALGTTATGLAAGAVASAAAGAAIGTVIGESTGLTAALTDLIDKHTGLSEASRANAKAEDEFNNKLIETRREVQEVLAGIDGLGQGLDDARPKWQRQIDLLDEQNETSDRLTSAFAKQGLVYDEVTGKLTPFNDGIKDLSGIIGDLEFKQKNLADETRGYRTIIDEATGKVIGFEQAGDKLATSLDKTADSAEDATKKSDDFLTKMEEIASNERIKLIEARVDLQVANLEADTKRVEAAFGSINNTISSTGDVISSAVGQLGNFADAADSLAFNDSFQALQDQIKVENKLRQQAFDLQKELNSAVVENLRAKSAALRRGDALLTIKGDGLSPAIKAFMFEILDEIQVEMNAQFQEFLLAVDPAAAV